MGLLLQITLHSKLSHVISTDSSVKTCWVEEGVYLSELQCFEVLLDSVMFWKLSGI